MVTSAFVFLASAFVFLVAGCTVPGFVLTDSLVPEICFRGCLVEYS